MSKGEQNLVVFTLDYSYLIHHESNAFCFYSSKSGLWRSLIDGSSNLGTQGSYKILDNLSPLRTAVSEINFMSQHGEIVNISDPQLNHSSIMVSIIGNDQFVNDSRIKILQSFNKITYKCISLSEIQLYSMDETFFANLDLIAKTFEVEIFIDSIETDFKTHYKKSSNYSLYIIGNADNASIAESQTKVIVDTSINKFQLHSIDLPLSLIPLTGGDNLADFALIAQQLSANIYVPDLLPELFNSNIISSTFGQKIYITAKDVGEVLYAEKIMKRLIDEARSKLYLKEINFSKVKLDLFALFNQKEILSIMLKHGTFIQLPSLGEPNSYSIQVQGQTLNAVDMTIHDLTLLSAKYYTFCISFKTSRPVNDEMTYQVASLQRLRKASFITLTENGLEVCGEKSEIHALLKDFESSNFWSTFLQDCEMRMKIEMDTTQKNFISGKKNGKMVKIINQFREKPLIRYTPFNEYIFHVNIAVTDSLSSLIRSVQLIELEVPAESQFNIPEVFHKSIIGNGGSTIQSIMKKYNVFIKFSSNSDEQRETCYSFKRYDNVLIKCPQKNSKNISLAKRDIEQLAHQCCMNIQPLGSNVATYFTSSFTLLKSHYLLLANQLKLKKLMELESQYNVFISFPKSLYDFNNKNEICVDVKGSDCKVKQATEKLKELLPQNFEFKLAPSPRFSKIINEKNKEFKEKIIMPLKLVLGVELLFNEVRIEGDSAMVALPQILVSGYDRNSMETAISDLTFFLRDKNFSILEKHDFQFNPAADAKNDKIFSASNVERINRSLKVSQAQMAAEFVKSSSTLRPITNKMSYIGKLQNSAKQVQPKFRQSHLPISSMRQPFMNMGPPYHELIFHASSPSYVS